MTPEQIKQLNHDARAYPLPLRIAALLYIEGVTYKQAFEMNLSPQIRACYHDIQFGNVVIAPRLQELALSLVGKTTPTLHPFPTYGDLMPISEFAECVRQGGFKDYDGYGRYATEEGVSEIVVSPSQFKKHGPNPTFTHIVWFNR